MFCMFSRADHPFTVYLDPQNSPKKVVALKLRGFLCAFSLWLPLYTPSPLRGYRRVPHEKIAYPPPRGGKGTWAGRGPRGSAVQLPQPEVRRAEHRGLRPAGWQVGFRGFRWSLEVLENKGSLAERSRFLENLPVAELVVLLF